MSSHTVVPIRTTQVPELSAAPGGFLQRQCSCGEHTASGGECDECKKKEGMLQRHAAGAGPATAPTIVNEIIASPGRCLSSDVRAIMEPRFGHDFSHVQLHTDARADDSARSVGALAYTIGDHIAFQSGHYNPVSGEGRRLLAHELTHVVQNRKYGTQLHGSSKSISHPSDASEREADAAAERLVEGGSLEVNTAPSSTTQRDVGDVLKDIGIGAGIAGGAALLGWGLSKLLGGGKSDQDPACAKSLSIPDDVHQAVGKAWGESGHGGETVAEHGGRIVTDSSGKRTIRTGAGGGGSISLPGEQAGDVTTGTFHTHPYSKSEGSTLGVGFSGGDIENFIAGGQGSVKYVGAGSCNFVLNTIDQTKRDACKSKDINRLWNDAFSKAGGDFQDKVATAVKASIAGCGICFYRACRPDDKSAIPQTAKLA